MTHGHLLIVSALSLACGLPGGVRAQAAGSGAAVYRCPGPPVLYTDALSPQEARERGCRTIEGAPITIVQDSRPRPPGSASAPTSASAARPAEARVDAAVQRARDSDARRILTEELRREEERLALLRKEYNDGQPERRGEERNYQKYLDRVAAMKSDIARRRSSRPSTSWPRWSRSASPTANACSPTRRWKA